MCGDTGTHGGTNRVAGYDPGVDLSGLFSDLSISWWDMFLAVIALVGGWAASRVAKRGITALMYRIPNISPGLVRACARISQYAVLLLGFGLALAFLGANIQPLIAMVFLVGLVGVLVLRGVADNFASGVLIQARRPVIVGEQIMVEGLDGEPIVAQVDETTSRTVVLSTTDGRTIHVPNSKLLEDVIVNESRHGQLRSELEVRIERGEASVDDLLAGVEATMASTDGVLEDREPRALATSISPSRVTAKVQFWHEPGRGTVVSNRVVRAISRALEDDGLAATVSSAPQTAPITPSDPV